MRKKEISHASLNRHTHQDTGQKIHGLSVRYAESEPRDVSATLLSLIVGALTFFPALLLGPVVQGLTAHLY